MKNFSKKRCQNFGSTKIHGLAQKIGKYEGFTCSRARLTLKMGRFGHQSQLDPYLRPWWTSMKNFGKNDIRIPDHQKFMKDNTQKSAKIRGLPALCLIWPWKWVVLVVRANGVHNYGLNWRPWEILIKMTSKFWITKNTITQL